MTIFLALAILASLLLIYFLSEYLLLIWSRLSKSEFVNDSFIVIFAGVFIYFSVKASDIIRFGNSKSIIRVASLDYRAEKLARSGNYLVITYERHLFNISLLPKGKFDQVIVARNGLLMLEILKEKIPDRYIN